MFFTFNIVPKSSFLSDTGTPNTAFLTMDNWDDFGFKTLFLLHVYDEKGKLHEVGGIHIGFKGQTGGFTSDHLDKSFQTLPENFFSLGTGVEYYTYVRDNFPDDVKDSLLKALRDVAYNTEILSQANQEAVFGTSFLRSTSLSVVTNQYVRVLQGGATLTSYNFSYTKPRSSKYSGIKLDFKVTPESNPSSNIHILIGRNGVGKTTLLNSMVQAALSKNADKSETGFFKDNDHNFANIAGPRPLAEDYFSGVISVSFSAFDPFVPPQEQNDPTKGMCYYYIGLKDQNGRHKETSELGEYFIESFRSCIHMKPKRELWLKAIKILESDQNFADMNLQILAEPDEKTKQSGVEEVARYLFRNMSSGHAIVLLTLTRLIEKVEEKTLILLDEPESHLHPPLLAAFTRALSDLLISRNGLAIVATHSPVVLQEVPKFCVSIVRRSRLEATVDRPEIETFAENVGTLTREVFGLEVSKSGFHALLEESVASGKTFNEIMHEYNDQIGFEGRAILQSLINSRNTQQGT
ncbi:MAG: hypothetical protein CMH27_03635 [Micavibrio sp.]|nr:hypothetical protein [Micavibrio sp.]